MSDFADKHSKESTLGENAMIDFFANEIGNLCIIVLAVIAIVSLHKLNNKQIRKHQESLEYYLYKISRVTGHSEYDVFFARVSKEKIDADFKNYLSRNAVPPYVNHFVRQNKHHIDELHLPRI
jgi:hypothetical protein